MAVPTRNFALTTLLSIFLGLLAMAGSANSQSSSASPSSTSATSSAAVSTHTVTVGVDGFTYNPKSLTANVGDTVIFIFYPQNHSVARAEFGYPCIPYENTGPNKTGFWSGFQPISAPSENGPKFYLKINNTEPTFFYCSAPGACVPNGMIGVINPNATQTLEEQAAFAANATLQLSPGEQNPSESTPSPTPSSSSSASSSTSSNGISGGAIAGIVIGAIAVIALAGLTFYLCGRNRTLASVLRYSQPPSRPHNIPPVPYSPSQAGSPYSPEFSPKPGHSPSTRPILSADSWATQNTGQQMRPISPEMSGTGGPMSPQLFNPSYGNTGYNAVENPGNGNNLYGGNQSPQGSPWAQHSSGFNQIQYAQVPNEMATGQEPLASPGQHSYISHQSHQTQSAEEVHELDARSAVPDSPSAAPPQYAARTFSFSEGGDAPPGVEKVLRD